MMSFTPVRSSAIYRISISSRLPIYTAVSVGGLVGASNCLVVGLYLVHVGVCPAAGVHANLMSLCDIMVLFVQCLTF